MNPNRDQNLSWVDRDIARFKDTGLLIPKSQWKIYQKIKDHWVSGRTVVDVGCSIGVGSNVLSHKARHVWGIDINEEAIKFAKSAFYRPNLSFDVIDIENPTTRPYSPFEVVVMVEVLEHLDSPEEGLGFIKRFFNPKLDTVGFISAPNVGNSHVKVADDKNELHMHRWTAGEFYNLLTSHFKHVVLFSQERLKNWDMSETVDGITGDRVIIAKVEVPL